MKLFKFTNTIKNQIKRSKRILLLLITITTFTNLGYAQWPFQHGLSKGFSIEAGLGTSHAPTLISLNYDIPLNDKFYWTVSTGGGFGGDGVLVMGIRNVNKWNNHRHTLVFGKDYTVANEMLLRYSWVKEREIGYSGNWSLNYGVQIQLVRWSYEQNDSYDYIWAASTLINVVGGGFYTLFFLPYPLINLKYQL